MRYLGLDIGAVRVGIAVSDEGGTIAFPLEIVPRKACLTRIQNILTEKSISTVIIGESLNLDGEDNAIMHDIRQLAGRLAAHATILFEPEQFSTQAAARLGKGTDDEAAALILQSYLDRLSNNKGT